MVDVAGGVVLVVFYVIILLIGILAAKYTKTEGASETERSLVAGRQLNLGVGIISMAASAVGGGFLNGFAESVALYGVVWMLMPIGGMIALCISSFAFGGVMRKRRYLTMLDPFNEKYGKEVTAVLFLGALFADIVWAAAILSALGSSLQVMIELDFVISVVVSAAIAVFYTMIGQMIAVAYTDVVELAFIIIGLSIAIPFAATNENVNLSSLSETPEKWRGTIEPMQIASYIDMFLALWILSSVPWQCFIQRFLSAKSVRGAKIMGVVGGILVAIVGVAPITIGVIGIATDWKNTSYGEDPIPNEANMILPLVIFHLTPEPVAIIGLCAITAAVMSSIDSAILGSSGMFTQNVYRVIIHKKASPRELTWVRRVSLVVLGVGASLIAIYGGKTVIGLYYISADIALVVFAPQLICSMYIDVSNGYGAMLGSGLALVLIFGNGVSALDISPFVPYPPYDSENVFPVRILCVIVALLTTVIISYFTKMMFKKRLLARRFDILNQFSTTVMVNADIPVGQELKSDGNKDTYEAKDLNAEAFDNP
ncbi:unnamed protein product [Owenia fusiformis]|uniref:Uncharacterized protein n=1 Tax=Owenia fusiformis TaxID=6347 RepID=A0A8J1TUX9_OWEFU|nr:unnamed protein product [Owenia fusiformis]